MKRPIHIVLTIIPLLLIAFQGMGQSLVSTAIDSLERRLGEDPEPKLRTTLLNELFYMYISADTERAAQYADSTMAMLEEHPNPTEQYNYYLNVGRFVMRQGDYDSARVAYSRSLDIVPKIPKGEVEAEERQRMLARSYEGVGVAFRRQGNYSKALEYYLEALRIREQIDKPSSVASSYNNIGVIYFYQDNYQKASEYYRKALNKLDSKTAVSLRGAVLLNLGEALSYLKEYRQSLDYYEKSLTVYDSIRDEDGIAYCYHGIGETRLSMQQPDSAMRYLNRALLLREQLAQADNIAITLNVLGKAHYQRGDYSKAVGSFKRAEENAKKVNYPDPVKDAYKGLADSYHQLGKDTEAYQYHVKFKEMSDSLRNEAQIKKLARLESEYGFEQDRLRFEEEAKIQEARQQATYVGLGLASLLALLAIGFLWDKQKSSRRLAKAHSKLESSHTELKSAYEELHAAQEELHVLNESLLEQRNMLDQNLRVVQKQQHDILSSINYAERIQKAILPSTKKLESAFEDYFLLFHPRDIVSGDFYWMHQDRRSQKTVLAVADCTGHGVPGAFMSMVGNDLLHYAIKDQRVERTDQLLKHMSYSIRTALNQEESQSQDGMEIGLVAIDQQSKTLEFTGARRPLIYIQEGELHIIKGDRKGIGGKAHPSSQAPFSRHEISFDKPTCFYLLSDGFQDQFGGPQGRKFMIKRLKELLLEIHEQPMKQQQERLESELQAWMGELNQVDDIIVFGVRLG